MEKVNTQIQNVGFAVARYFKTQGISYIEAAEKMRFKNKQTIANQMQFAVFPPKTAVKYAQAFGFSLDFLLTGQGELQDKEHLAVIAGLQQEIGRLHMLLLKKDREIARLKSLE